jgi:hypothetical protein
MKKLNYELAVRESDGIEVNLLWNRVEDRVLLNVCDTRTGECFVCGVERADALDAFRHPFSYAARRQRRANDDLGCAANQESS